MADGVHLATSVTSIIIITLRSLAINLNMNIHVVGVAASSCDTYSGWRSFDNKCYFYRDTTASWANAELYCTGTGGHIVSIESQEEADFIADYQLSYQFTHWLGFTDKVRTDV